jgi:hypothetical protein
VICLEILMKSRCLAALLLMPALAVAQAAPPDPSNPDAQVPPVAYRSVFADTPRGVEAEATDWKKANAEVGQFRRGHVDLLKWEEDHARQTPGAPTPQAVPMGPHHHSLGGKP